MTFAPGDVVALKSGGHSMTVVSISEEDIDCLWVGDDGVLFRQSIPLIALTIVESAMEDTDDEAEHDEDEDEDKDDDEDEDSDDDEEEHGKKRKKRND